MGTKSYTAGLAYINIEKLPHHLFKSDVEYFLLYFLKHGPAPFNAAKRSLERHAGRTKHTLMGYTESRMSGKRFYRGESFYDSRVPTALWWRPFGPNTRRAVYTPTGELRRGPRQAMSKEPFALTRKGINRAYQVADRVQGFLHALVSDLTLEV